MILFNTSAIIDFLRGGAKPQSVIWRIERKGGAIYTTVISQYELPTPVYHKGLKTEERNIRAFLGRSVVFPLDHIAAEESSRIMGEML